MRKDEWQGKRVKGRKGGGLSDSQRAELRSVEGYISPFGDNLKRLCGLHALGLRDLAGEIGVSRQSVTSWVNSTYQPNARALVALEELFEIPASLLVAGDFRAVVSLLGDQERYDRVEARLKRRRELVAVAHELENLPS